MLAHASQGLGSDAIDYRLALGLPDDDLGGSPCIGGPKFTLRCAVAERAPPHGAKPLRIGEGHPTMTGKCTVYDWMQDSYRSHRDQSLAGDHRVRPISHITSFWRLGDLFIKHLNSAVRFLIKNST